MEDAPQERYDAYAFGKLKQEDLVPRVREDAWIAVRYSATRTVFGPGKKELSGRIGIDTFGFFMHVGGSNLLPLTFVDNCAEAIVLAGLVPGVDGEIFNIVDDELLTSAQFLRAYKRHVRSFFSLRVPYFVVYALCRLWEEHLAALAGTASTGIQPSPLCRGVEGK